MLDESKYPHFIPDKPKGEDVFEGKSQEHLAASICNYINTIDVNPDKKGGVNIPRIIGLEGNWGSGKSNVVRMIESMLAKDGYYTFTYDAWGHQEDLQRRSMLETMTSHLIDNGILRGEVEIKMRNGKPHRDTWNNQLSLLLSNKITTIRKSTPKLTSAALWGIGIVALFAYCSLVAGQLIVDVMDFKCYWWIDIIPIIVALIVAFIFRCKDGSFDNILRMVDYTNIDTIDEEFTSSEEPSVAEFKNWMQSISNHFGRRKEKYKKLIIVFDNMDRLPSEKVMQLWSSIYTFFAGGEFENIWTIIPYDYKHLCQAITGHISDDNDKRIKRFINKTFPITYIVPQPVITDYEKLFYSYFDKAFGETEHDRKRICQVFMCLKKHPNPRTVITFVNDLVSLRMQWPDSKKYRLENLALFVLKKEYLFYNEGINDGNANLESNLLSKDLFRDIAHYYPDADGITRRQICQFAYGLEDENLAGELPLRLELQRLLAVGGSIKDYVSQPNFVTVLENVLSDFAIGDLDNIVKSMLSIDGFDFGDEQSSILSNWDMLANIKINTPYTLPEYDFTLDTLVKHSTEKKVKELTISFCRAMHNLPIENGESYYDALSTLNETLESIGSTIKLFDYVIPSLTTPEHFIEFLKKAGPEYSNYKLNADNEELNFYLLNNAICGDETAAIILKQLLDDKKYNFTYLKENITKKIIADDIKDDIRPAAYINRILYSGDGIIENRFSEATVTSCVNSSKIPWTDESCLGTEDVLAMYMADGKDLADVDDNLLPRISECIEKYIDSSKLLTQLGATGTAYNKLNAYMITNKKGQKFDIPYFAENLLAIKSGLGLDAKTLLDYSNNWEFEDIKDLTESNVQEYVHQELFSEYLACPGHFTEGLIKHAVRVLESQKEGFLVTLRANPNNPRLPRIVINPYWKQFVLNFVGTSYLPKLNLQLSHELITLLKRIIESNTIVDQELLDFMLRHEGNDAILRTYLNDVMNNHFSKTDITPLQFKVFGNLLPVLTSDMDINLARNLSIHLIKPIYRDKECAQIIVTNKDFYFGILKKDSSIVQDVIKGMIENPETLGCYNLIKEDLDELLIKEDKKDKT